MMGEHLQQVRKALVDLDTEDMGALIRESLQAGEEASALLSAMREAMIEVGKRFETGEYFLADLVMAGEMMKEGLAELEPHLAAERKEKGGAGGTVVLCTVRGDIHDIGKNLVGTMLTGAGFRVVDLGVDVPAEKVVEAVRANSAQAVGLSVLLTTMIASVGEVVEALEKEGIRQQVKIAIGGACVTPEVVERYGVDAMGKDAVEAVRIFSGWMSRGGES